MFKIKIADINILVHNKYEFTRLFCSDYLTDEAAIDLEVSCTDEEILEEIKASEIDVTPEYVENVCIHRAIAERLAEFDAFLFHSALLECDGLGIAFAAHSGVGKSTHVGLWKKVYGDRVRIINGDKPIVRFINGQAIAYGTPWLGKEGEGVNDSCPLKAVCFISRGSENSIKKTDPFDVILELFGQVYVPKLQNNAEKTLELLDRFTSITDFYSLKCNMMNDAAITAHKGILGDIKE